MITCLQKHGRILISSSGGRRSPPSFFFMALTSHRRREMKPSRTKWNRRSQGILFFSYGEEQETVEFYLREATTSARRIKDLNPGTNITIVTNPGISPDLTTAFDMVRHPSGFLRFSQMAVFVEYLNRRRRNFKAYGSKCVRAEGVALCGCNGRGGFRAERPRFRV